MSSVVQPLIDALSFIKFTDRAIGNRFKEALNALDEDMTDEEYEPSPKAEEAYKKLAEEIEDALNQEDTPPPETELPVIQESELPEEEKEELPVIKLDDADEEET